MSDSEKGKAWRKRVSNEKYDEGWDRIFGKKKKKPEGFEGYGETESEFVNLELSDPEKEFLETVEAIKKGKI